MKRYGLLKFAAVLIPALWASTAIAQDGSANGGGVRVFDHFLVSGGAITWCVLLPLSLATVALTIEYAMSIRRSTFVPAALFRAVAEHLQARRFRDAVELTADDPSILAGVMNTGLMESANGFSAMERAVEDALESRAARLMRKIEYLNVIGNVSPMIGLFGTVYGMIRLFASIKEAGGMPEPARIADDLSIALVTTFWGLLVAIPTLSVFALFRNRIDILTAECAEAADRLLSILNPSAPSVGRQAAAASPKAPAGARPAAAVQPAAVVQSEVADTKQGDDSSDAPSAPPATDG